MADKSEKEESVGQPLPVANIRTGEKYLLDDGRIGTCRFKGPTKFANGIWVGLVIENGTGNNDGCVDGISYKIYLFFFFFEKCAIFLIFVF